VHTVLDLLTLAATSWIIFLMMTRAKSTWQADKDTLWEVYIVRGSCNFNFHAQRHGLLSVMSCAIACRAHDRSMQQHSGTHNNVHLI
jgi:hypothetical protein